MRRALILTAMLPVLATLVIAGQRVIPPRSGERLPPRACYRPDVEITVPAQFRGIVWVTCDCAAGNDCLLTVDGQAQGQNECGGYKWTAEYTEYHAEVVVKASSPAWFSYGYECE